MVGAADMNDDGIFQADELVDLRITKPNLMKILFLGNCPDKFGGDVSQFANPKSLEKVFDKVAHR
jgi:hypothetical protein